MNMIALQEKFVVELLKPIGTSWDAVNIHFEHTEVNGNEFTKYIAKIYKNGILEQFDPSLDAIDILIEINETPPVGQQEKWSWVEFSIDSDGKYKFDYRYGIPPLVADTLR